MSVFSILKFIAAHPLGRRTRWASLAEFARWQLLIRALRPNSLVVHDWVDGSRLLMGRGMTGATGNLYVGLHEFEEMAFAAHLLMEGDLFVDVGANVGSYTILAGSRGARVISFEPIQSAHETLRMNVAINNLADRAELHQCALGDSEGSIRMTAGLDTVNHVAQESERSIEVPLKTLDGIIGERSPVLMKIDVEGFELPVLKGAEQTLSKSSLAALIIETNGSGSRYGIDDKRITDLLTAAGFVPVRYDGFSRVLTRSPKPKTDGNTIFVRSVETLAPRLRQAKPISVRGVEI